MARRGDDLSQGFTTGQIRCENSDAQLREWYKLTRRKAHAAGRSVIVVFAVITAPLRIKRRSAFRPMLPEPKYLAIFRNRCVEFPSTLRMISPARIPACAAGPFSRTDITIKPLDWSAASRSASGTAT